MSNTAATEAVPPSPSTSKSKKAKKKKTANKPKAVGDNTKPNGTHNEPEDVVEEGEAGQETPTDRAHSKQDGERVAEPTDSVQSTDNEETPQTKPQDPSPQNHSKDRARKSTITQPPANTKSEDDTEARLEALARDREALREEVATLRKSLEEVQGKHNEEIGGVQQQLEETRGEKEQWESNYQKLLGRVNTIKQQLGERLKSDAEDLSQARIRIEELEEQNSALTAQNEGKEEELANFAQEAESQSKEASGLRNKINLANSAWERERADLLQREAYAKEEFDSAKQAMQDWEILAMEERSIREGLAEKVSDLEEQLTSHREAHEMLEAERESQTLTVDGLQRAMADIQEARKRELREMVENTQSQISELRKELEVAQEAVKKSSEALKAVQAELERTKPFEAEVREKTLLVQQKTHQAVILNEHLTRALKQLKQGKTEDTIDRQLVNNHILQFLAIDRADPRKFQVLQIIASILNWSDDQREAAGLARPGMSNVNLRTPISIWHRTPSVPNLTSDYPQDDKARQDSLGGLFQEFLEKESQDESKK